MARSLQQIETDLKSLEIATQRLDQDLKSLYQEYLTVLGKAVKQQLVLAVYYLCTQAYPEAFLDLSASQRANVQTRIRKLARQGDAQLTELGQIMMLEAIASSLEATIPIPEATMEAEETAEPSSEIDPPEVAVDAAPEAQPEEENAQATEIAQRLNRSLSLFASFTQDPLSPILLAKRHVLLERHLRAILQTLSNLANYVLKQAQVLPDLPEIVLAAAAESEPGEAGGHNTPNLLNVLVEIGSDRSVSSEEMEEDLAPETDDFDDEDEDEDDDDDDREMTHLVAVNLRLADIEYSDTHTALWRNRIQEALVKLKRLGSQYQKLLQEKARADAEHAWRATWFED